VSNDNTLVEDGGFVFFVISYLEGGDLHDAIVDGALTPDLGLQCVLAIGEVLHHAHQRHMVHRDVKPQNILLSEDLQPHLSDFDLVRTVDSTGGTRTGALGSLLFAAPEMLQDAKRAGVTADVYALGMTAVFCLYGAPLSLDFVRDAPALIRQLETSSEVKAVLTRAVCWNSEDRYPTVKEFTAALRAGLPPRLPDPRRGGLGVVSGLGLASVVAMLLAAFAGGLDGMWSAGSQGEVSE